MNNRPSAKILAIIITLTFLLASCGSPGAVVAPTAQTQAQQSAQPTSTAEPTATAITPPTATLQPVTVGNANGAISFVQAFGAWGPQLQMVGPDGADIKVLAKNFGMIWYYLWSPDEKHIAIMSTSKPTDAVVSLYVIDLATAVAKKISKPDQYVRGVAWSPDNRTLLFSTTEGAGNDSKSFLYTADIDNPAAARKVPLEMEAVSIAYLGWSADGQKISFSSSVHYEGGSDAWKSDWYVAAPDGTQLQRIDADVKDAASDMQNFVWSTAWSPTDSRIAMASIYAITAHDINTRESQTLVRNPYAGFAIINLSWSPDGKQIAYNVAQLGPASYPVNHLRVYSLDKGIDREVAAARDEKIENFAWSPDSSQLAFAKCADICTIYRVDVRTGITSMVSAVTPGIISLTLKWVAPVSVSPPVVPATPTPIASWAALPSPPIYDDFSASTLDTNLWKIPDSDSYKYVIDNRQLKVTTKGYTNNQDFSMQLGEARIMNSSVVLDARVKINSGDFVSGGWGVAKTAIWLNSGDMKWATQCRLGNNLLKPTFVCDAAKTGQGYNVEYQTKSLPIRFDRWYDVRIEIRRSDGAVQYYLDNVLLDTYLSDYARQLTYHVTNLSAFVGEFVEYGWISAYFDDVRISN